MKRQFCKRGHLLQDPNLYYNGNGDAYCRRCHLDRNKDYRPIAKFPHHLDGRSGHPDYKRIWTAQKRTLARLCEALNGVEYREFDVLLVRRRNLR